MNKIELRINDRTTLQDFNPNQAAVIIVDVWDAHWCKYYKELNESLAIKISSFVEKIRKAGIKIIHTPCGSSTRNSGYASCVSYYDGHQARKNATDSLQGEAVQYFKRCTKPGDIFFKGVKQDGGKFCTCVPPCPRPWPRPWTRQHDAISVTDEDYITDDVVEVSHILHRDKINRIFYVGGALNACLIDRPHCMGSRYDGVSSAFIRDLTISHLPRDDIFNIGHNDTTSQNWPGRELRKKFVKLCRTYNIQVYRDILSYKSAHEIQSKYIEKEMCPSILSEELLSACAS